VLDDKRIKDWSFHGVVARRLSRDRPASGDYAKTANNPDNSKGANGARAEGAEGFTLCHRVEGVHFQNHEAFEQLRSFTGARESQISIHDDGGDDDGDDDDVDHEVRAASYLHAKHQQKHYVP
jgi:hypothetical protein